MIATAWSATNLTLAFVFELVAVGALAYWGFRTGRSRVAKVLLGLGMAVAAIVLWGLFAAPQASYSLPVAAVATKVAVFGGASAGLWQLGHRAAAVVFPLLVVANLAVIHFGHLSL
ncbi:YrdB family protein [Nocardia sp. CDC153]|uniref:YrdB family protein n=1 Tax=Nocardia sp. CDC153 TaxID=3112167 RepID=UPI002DBDBF82|nr:YrdB family protein [Nocardia sp. CDC153]MEC3951405.1 YrdB family protein [Nocardia sp. CDC153]